MEPEHSCIYSMVVSEDFQTNWCQLVALISPHCATIDIMYEPNCLIIKLKVLYLMIKNLFLKKKKLQLLIWVPDVELV